MHEGVDLVRQEPASAFLKDGISSGRVEVCIDGGGFGSVCDEEWDDRDASVVCQQLGFSPYGEWYKYSVYPSKLFLLQVLLLFQGVIMDSLPWTLR